MALKQDLSDDQELNKFRTRSCRRILDTGDCSFASHCMYSHYPQWPRRRHDKVTYSPELCPHVRAVPKPDGAKGEVRMEYACPDRKHCPYSHTKEEILYHRDMFKTRICEEYRDGRPPGCHRHYCPFAHGEHELRKSQRSDAERDAFLAQLERFPREACCKVCAPNKGLADELPAGFATQGPPSPRASGSRDGGGERSGRNLLRRKDFSASPPMADAADQGHEGPLPGQPMYEHPAMSAQAQQAGSSLAGASTVSRTSPGPMEAYSCMTGGVRAHYQQCMQPMQAVVVGYPSWPHYSLAYVPQVAMCSGAVGHPPAAASGTQPQAQLAQLSQFAQLQPHHLQQVPQLQLSASPGLGPAGAGQAVVSPGPPFQADMEHCQVYLPQVAPFPLGSTQPGAMQSVMHAFPQAAAQQTHVTWQQHLQQQAQTQQQQQQQQAQQAQKAQQLQQLSGAEQQSLQALSPPGSWQHAAGSPSSSTAREALFQTCATPQPQQQPHGAARGGGSALDFEGVADGLTPEKAAEGSYRIQQSGAGQGEGSPGRKKRGGQNRGKIAATISGVARKGEGKGSEASPPAGRSAEAEGLQVEQ